MDVNEELKFLCKFKKNIYIFFFCWGGGGRVGRGDRVGGGGQGRCEPRSEVFVKIQKKNWEGRVGGGGGGGGWGVRVDVNKEFKFFGGSGVGFFWGGQGRFEHRSEVFVKIQKKNYYYFFFGGGGGGVGSGGGGGGPVRGVRVDVNEE